MSPRVRTTASFLLVFLALTFLYGRPIIQNDGITYYALAYSLIHDHDFDLTNQATQFRDLRVIPSTKTGRIASIYSCGFAVLYAPIMMLTEAIAPLNAIKPYAQNVTFPFSDSLAVFLGSVIFGLLSIFIASSMLRKYGLDRLTAFAISFAIFCATPLIFYTFTTPSFTHAADTFLFSVIFYITIRKEIRLRYVLIGFFLGLSVLLRNVNFSIIFPIVIGLLYFERSEDKKHSMIALAQIAAGALPVLVILLSYNVSQYGSFLATGYPVPLPDEGIDFVGMFSSFQRMVFEPSMGLFIWSPLTLISLIGLIIGCVKKKPDAMIATFCVITVVGTLCFFRIMFPGATFGNRFLTHLYIFWVLGLYEAFVLRPKPMVVVSTVLVLWSFFLFNAYYINFASPESRKILSDLNNVSPIKVTETAFNTYKGQQSATNPIQFWYRSLASAPYPSLHALMWHPDSRHQSKKPKRKRFKSGTAIQ